MAYILYIETATSICSVCVSQDLEILSRQTAEQPRVHTREATLMIESVMRSAELSYGDLSAIVLSDGPGSYTGLRVGASIAKGLCFGLNIPLITVNTLASLAQASIQAEPDDDNIYIPMIDARRMEVYLAHYQSDMKCRQENIPYIFETGSFDDLLKSFDKVVFSGNGSPKIKELVDNQSFVFTGIVCDATHLVGIGYSKYQDADFQELAYYSPNYIKPPNITKRKKKLI